MADTGNYQSRTRHTFSISSRLFLKYFPLNRILLNAVTIHLRLVGSVQVRNWGNFMKRFFAFAITLTLGLSTSWALAEFSTSIMKPTPVDATGVISASFPSGGQKASYYFS